MVKRVGGVWSLGLVIVAVAINSLSTGFFESGGSTHGPPTSSAGGMVGSQDLSPEAGGRVTSEVSLGRRTLEIKKKGKSVWINCIW